LTTGEDGGDSSSRRLPENLSHEWLYLAKRYALN
jgi:hypothetical protein